MARRVNNEEPSYGLVIYAILYGFITLIAIYFGIEYDNSESVLKVQLICAAIASIIMAFALPKGKDHADTRKRASYVFTHLVLWGGIIFLPFGDHPMLALGALFLLGISEAGYVASLNKDQNTLRSDESKQNLAGIAGRLALLIFAIIIIITVLKETGYDKKVIHYYKSFISGFESTKKDSNKESSRSENSSNETSSSSKISVSFLQWSDPLVLQIDRAFTTSAKGTIDLNDASNEAAILEISLPKSGNIRLTSGTVEFADENGGKVSGTWEQEKTGLTGNYTLSVKQSGARLVLKYNMANVAIIELKQIK